jgi:hypothetical protein
VWQACRYGHVQHLEHLLFYAADMGVQNASGNTALHICALYNQVRKHKPPISSQSTVQRGLYSTTYNVLIGILFWYRPIGSIPFEFMQFKK